MSLCFFGTFFFFVTAITSGEGAFHRVFVLATSSSREAWLMLRDVSMRAFCLWLVSILQFFFTVVLCLVDRETY